MTFAVSAATADPSEGGGEPVFDRRRIDDVWRHARGPQPAARSDRFTTSVAASCVVREDSPCISAVTRPNQP